MCFKTRHELQTKFSLVMFMQIKISLSLPYLFLLYLFIVLNSNEHNLFHIANHPNDPFNPVDSFAMHNHMKKKIISVFHQSLKSNKI